MTQSKSDGVNREDASLLLGLSTTKSTAPVTSAPDYRPMALQKCYDIEAFPASEWQTMASLVASAALHLADHGGYVEGDIAALHRAADFIVTIPDVKATAHNEGVHFGVYDFADYLQSLPVNNDRNLRDAAGDYFTDVEACGDDLDVE